MKLSLKTYASFLAIALAFASSTAFSMDDLEQRHTHRGEGHHSSSVLSSEMQNRLTEVGHDMLKNILYIDDFDISKAGLFDKIYPQLKPALGEAQYSKLASWKPSNLIRWGFSSDDQSYIITRKNQMIAIIALGWAMTDLAKQQNDFFERGSFSIIDPEHRLTNFLLDYVKLTTGYDDPQTVPFALTTCNFAYRRDPSLHGSSHHSGHCPESQFGIDVRFEPSEGVLKLLPFDSTHLLFAKLHIDNQAEPLLFLKFEPVGMGSIGAIAVHGLGFLHSQSHVAMEARREKDIKDSILTSFKDLQCEAGLEGEFKTMRAMYLEIQRLLIQTTLSTEDSENDARKPISLEDSIFEGEIGQFYPVFQGEKDIQKDKNIHEKAKSFISRVNEMYPNGNNHLRVGNEVLIDLKTYKRH